VSREHNVDGGLRKDTPMMERVECYHRAYVRDRENQPDMFLHGNKGKWKTAQVNTFFPLDKESPSDAASIVQGILVCFLSCFVLSFIIL
jgi:hypothetical protein